MKHEIDDMEMQEYIIIRFVNIYVQGVAKFMEKVNGGRVKFEADRIVMGGGATGANEVMMFCLADPGDAFLIPSPYYPAYVFSLLIYIHCTFNIYIQRTFTVSSTNGNLWARKKNQD